MAVHRSRDHLSATWGFHAVLPKVVYLFSRVILIDIMAERENSAFRLYRFVPRSGSGTARYSNHAFLPSSYLEKV
jgi:hypothetical protein